MSVSQPSVAVNGTQQLPEPEPIELVNTADFRTRDGVRNQWLSPLIDQLFPLAHRQMAGRDEEGRRARIAELLDKAADDVISYLRGIVARDRNIHRDDVTGQQIMTEFNNINLARHNGNLGQLYPDTEVGRRNLESAETIIRCSNILIRNNFFHHNIFTEAAGQAQSMDTLGFSIRSRIAENEVKARIEQQNKAKLKAVAGGMGR